MATVGHRKALPPDGQQRWNRVGGKFPSYSIQEGSTASKLIRLNLGDNYETT